MRHIDFKALRIFVEVMRYGSIAAAAQALGIRQPTVAYAIRKLRDVTGDELFFERRGMLVPTACGQRLERIAAGMLERWQGLVAQDGVRPARGAWPRHTLRLGMSMALGDPVLTQVLARLTALLPDVQIASGIIGNGRQAGQALGRGLIDCAVTVDGLPAAAGIVAEHVMMAQRSLIRLPASPLPGEGVGADEDADPPEHWILLTDDADVDSPVRRYLAGMPGPVRLTVAPSWNGQMALWRSRGGVTPLLKFNVPWIEGACAAYVPEVPEGFPAWAGVSLLYPAGRAGAARIDAVREALLAVLRGIAAATAPLPANDEALALPLAG
ncbi:LysR family transcriptional regulator [Cupriavidus necator]|uniref:LysR family transcriptional regulator n=1 Tax=Cupriavidus necator TaxID=106590 RepID=UPI00339D67E3